MKIGTILVAVGLALPAVAAVAGQPTTLSGDELRQAISGGKAYCYKLSRSGSSVQWLRNDGHSGTARLGR